ncbi:unnamed protein product [Chrysodeixis includens]|nr:unnamed protein product [Chrysodeixis includens]
MRNIHENWLQCIYAKTHKQMPIYVSKYMKRRHPPAIFGTIKQDIQVYNDSRPLELNFNGEAPALRSELKLDLMVPKQLAPQYFIQWQRYRKYWWSSMSMTPNLFNLSECDLKDTIANVGIVARFLFGSQPVESITVQPEDDDKVSHLSCVMTLEDALIILLLDGLTNNTKEEYLRLHRKIAPFKISFALELDDETSQRITLQKLATLLHYKLKSKKISTWLPNFTLPFHDQIQENLRMGVTYTAVLTETTLKHGIIRLMNSNTMLGVLLFILNLISFWLRSICRSTLFKLSY